MYKPIAIAVLALSLGACQTTNQQTGTLIGAGAGGLLGSQIGSGSGQLLATGVGVLIGAMSGSAIGESMDRPQTVVIQQSTPDGQCGHITNSGARSACERGVSERNAEAQREAERKAYLCGRYGECEQKSTIPSS